jgi:uncharacterized protein (TIGR00661 family)
LAPPIIRPVVSELTPAEGEQILVYATSGRGQEQLCQTLRKFASQKFYIYGFGKDLEYDNCVFRKRSTEGFLADLAGARGVIASAGFSLISECMHLRKKMLLVPLANQYEQIINAQYVQKLGLGVSSEKLDEAAIARLLDQLDKPMPSDERILWPDNERFFQILQNVLDKLEKPIGGLLGV